MDSAMSAIHQKLRVGWLWGASFQIFNSSNQNSNERKDHQWICEEYPYPCTPFVVMLILMSFLYEGFREMKKILDLMEKEIMKRND
jgi:hypothetical protein